MILGEAQPFASPEAALEHFGVKGMKWGVRKDQSPREPAKSLITEKIERTTPNGDVLTLDPVPPAKFVQWASKYSKRHADMISKSAIMDIKDKDGNSIGNAQIYAKSKDELNLVWLDIDRGHRGRGYAQSVMTSMSEIGKQKGFKKLTLEVPGISPDARHIYEKQGFKVVKEPNALQKKDIWSGLTHMEKKLD